MKLQDITSILSDAALEAQKQAEEQAHERFTQLFEDPDGDGTYTPRYVNIMIGDEKIKAPMFVLMNLTAVKTKEIVFELDTDIDLSGHSSSSEDNMSISVSLKKGLFKNSSHLKVSATFEGTDPPEALLQIQDELNNRISHALSKLENDEAY